MCYVVSSIAVTDGRREAVVGAASQGGGADGDSDRGGLRAAVRRHPVKHVPTQSIIIIIIIILVFVKRLQLSATIKQSYKNATLKRCVFSIFLKHS